MACTSEGAYNGDTGGFNAPPASAAGGGADAVNPVDRLAELANPHHLPRPFHTGQFDPNAMRREFLLLHDLWDGPPHFNGDACKREMQGRFGAGCCAILRINGQPIPPGGWVQDNPSRQDVGNYADADPDADPDADGGFYDNGRILDEDEIWDEHLPPDPMVGRGDGPAGDESRPPRGMCLTDQDKLVIRRYVANMVTSGLLPALERRISNLNIAVGNQRRGVKNVFKSFWRTSKSKSSDASVAGASMHGYSAHGGVRGDNASAHGPKADEVRYKHDAIESQIRLLADTLFMVRDYEAALGMYKLVRDDYKHDHAMVHYASVCEMMGLCLYLMDPLGGRHAREAYSSIETALYSYTRAAEEERPIMQAIRAAAGVSGSGGRPNCVPHSIRLATRLCLVLSTLRNLCQTRHMEVADLLASASSHETPQGAAVLLEQSSGHYYRAGMYRKYAFHMLMSGHMFRSAGSQDHHAFRCFASALYVYHGGRWGELYNHLRSALAAQMYGMGRMGVSMRLYAALVGTTGGGRVSVRSQQKFLSHLAEICQTHQEHALAAADRMGADGGDGARLVVGARSKNPGYVAGGGATAAYEEIRRGNPACSRHLEIPNMDLPKVHDPSIVLSSAENAVSAVTFKRMDSLPTDNGIASVEVGPDGAPLGSDEAGSDPGGGEMAPGFGVTSAGLDDVWEDMMCSVQAELRAVTAAAAEKNVAPGGVSQVQRKDDEDIIERVISEIDKEKVDVAFQSKQRAKAGRTGSRPTVRARMEPLMVGFSLSNPLGVDIRLSDIQLVATLKSGGSGRVCTNEHAISIGNESGINDTDPSKKRWRFNSSVEPFLVPDFLCISPAEDSSTVGSDDAPWVGVSAREEPFFVVTKSSVSLVAGSTLTVSLGICPLVTGDLEVLGLRCKLFDDIWVFHRFHVLGPLLQDSTFNRANRGELFVVSLHFDILAGQNLVHLTSYWFRIATPLTSGIKNYLSVALLYLDCSQTW